MGHGALRHHPLRFGRLGRKDGHAARHVAQNARGDDFAAGEPISYGRTYFTQRPSRIAVLPIGYADGLHRALSNQIEVLTPYGRAKQVGRICMDMCMIDVTDLPQVKSGDEVEIFGEHILCADDAALCDTIPYELMCAVSKRVPRVYRLNGVPVDKNLQPL